MLFVLDISVISELRKTKHGKPDANLIAWAAAQQPAGLYINAIIALELGLSVLQDERCAAAQLAYQLGLGYVSMAAQEIESSL